MKILTTGYYSIRTVCANCGVHRRPLIPRGRAITDHPCDVCGCKTLQREMLAVGQLEDRTKCPA